jgi:hypothetical protein
MIEEVRERTGKAKQFAKDVAYPFSVANIRWKPNAAKFVAGVPVKKTDQIVRSSRYRLRRTNVPYFDRWKEEIEEFAAVGHAEDDTWAMEGEGSLQLVRHKKREASLRAAKLESARAASSDGRLRCEVPGCGFDFEEAYGPLGAGYAQVHHLQPLALLSKSVKTTLDKLAVVCANCHAMVHHKGGCRPLKGLLASMKS